MGWFSSKDTSADTTSTSVPGSSITASLYNKAQYLLSKSISDPKADAYAKQQAEQAKQDAEMKKREEKAASDKAESEAKAAKEAEKAKALAARSRFDYKELISESAKKVLATFLSILLTLFLLYGGHLAANQAIGYKVPFRILSFIYGAIGAIYIIPMSLYKVYGKGETLPYYSFLPISTYVPNGTLEEIFLGGFCYQEDEASVAARSAVETLYSDAFKKSQAT